MAESCSKLDVRIGGKLMEATFREIEGKRLLGRATKLAMWSGKLVVTRKVSV